MASPLSMFRKYQYAFMVVFGVVLMIAFVIAPPILDYQRVRSEGARNTVVVSWKGGSLREDDVRGAILSRNLANLFLENLQQRTLAKNGYPRVPRVLSSSSEEDVLRTTLLAERAEKSGMRVSDEAIIQYLEQLTAELLSRAEIGEVFQQALGGRMSEAQLFNVLRTELLAQNYMIMVHPGLFLARGEAVTPYTAWQYHDRLRRRVKAEVVPLEVAKFKAQVKAEPTQAEVQALYDEAKDRYADPSRPDPGFKVRRRIEFAYAQGDFSAYEKQELDAARKSVTDEEIKQHYETNKQRYTVQTPAPPVTPPTTAPEKPDAAAKPAAEPAAPPASPSPPVNQPTPPAESPTTPPNMPAAPASPLPAPEQEKPAAAATPVPATSPPAEAAKPEPKPESKPEPAPEQKPETSPESKPEPKPENSPEPKPESKPEPAPEPKTETSPEPKPENSPEPKPESQSRSGVGASDVVFTSYMAEETPESKPEASPAPATPTPEVNPAGESAPSKPEAPAEPPKSVAPAPEAKPAEPAPEAKPAAPPAEAKPDAAAPPAKPEGATPEAKPAAAAPAKPEPQIRPLDEKLMSEIREELTLSKARKTAQDKLDKALADVKREVELYGRQVKKDGTTASKPLDLESFASQRGLTVGKTPLVDAIEVQEYGLGKSFDQAEFSWPPQRQSFASIAFEANVPPYRPADIQGENRDIYFVYWRVREEEPYVPKLESIRDKVVDVWKQREALKLARAEADKLVAQAKEAAKPLKEAFAGNANIKVEDTNEFTWLSTGFTPAGMGTPGLSFVDKVKDVGEDFMRSVFALKEGECGAAVNESQSFVYVVRIVSQAPTEDELKKQFLESGRSFEIQQIASIEGQRALRDWYKDVQTQSGVEWKRPVDAQRLE